MDSSTKRKVGAIALIVAGIGAFLVPFLLHSPGLQASNNGGGNTNGNNNSCTSNCTPACTSNCTPPSCTTNCSPDKNPGGSGSGPCTADPGKDSGDNDNQGKHLAKGHDGDQGDEGKHLALGHSNQNSQVASLVARAQGLMHALGKHNPQHDATHSTKTDNDTVKNHTAHSDNDDGTDASGCADTKSNDDSDDQGNDD
jgi:hypothetical protein